MGHGDDLMLAGEARRLREADAQKRKVAARHKKSGQRWTAVFHGNPDLATPSEVAGGLDVQWLDENAGRRYRASETPERRVWTMIGPARPVLHLAPAEEAFAQRAGVEHAVIVEPNIKSAATPNKDWGWQRWVELVRVAPAIDWVQLGPAGNTRLLPGVRHVMTPDFRHAAAVVARARGAVLPEGGLHHAAAAFFRPAVVIFGGYISPVQTGYPEHMNLFTGGTPCGWRTPCSHCRDAMAAITPTMVIAALGLLLASEPERKAA